MPWQKVSRNTNSWELLSHKSCSPVSALKGSNNFLICELKPNTLFFVLTMFISHLSPESQIRYKLQDKRALEGETNSAAFLNECSQYRSGLWICQIAGSLFCELRSTGLQLTISQLEYRAATQRQISGSGQEIQINTKLLQEDIFQRSGEDIRYAEFLGAPIA